MNAVDTTIEALVIRGAIDMARFIQGRACGGVIHWLDKHEKEEDLHRPGHARRVVIAVAFVFGLIALRATGAAQLLTTIRGWTGLLSIPEQSSLGWRVAKYALGVGIVVLSTVAQRYRLLI